MEVKQPTEWRQCVSVGLHLKPERKDMARCDFIIHLCIRVTKIAEMLQLIEVYSSLGLSHIEGIETLHSRFQLLVSGMKKKQYDVLDQRKTDFDADFEEFKRGALDIRVSRNVLCMHRHIIQCTAYFVTGSSPDSV